MLPKAHLTSHSRMSGSRWVITPSWLSGSWSFLYSSSVYSCHLFLISSASVRFMPFLSFIVPIFAWNVPLVSLNFLEEISSLFHSIVFLYFFALFTLGRLTCLSLLFFGTLHSDGNNKGQKPKGWDLTEAEEINKRWQEYTEKLYKKDLTWPR